MGLLDEYQNLEEDGAANSGTGTDPADLRKKRAEIERQIVITESDLKKKLRVKQDLEIEQRKLKKEGERLRVERDALDGKAKELENEIRLLEEEVRGLKKKQKVLI
ncbi:MAG: hypothetical protein WC831_01360 [Parcubacteria group bacterium]|jgi:chromosome segregation ATPase